MGYWNNIPMQSKKDTLTHKHELDKDLEYKHTQYGLCMEFTLC